MSIRSILSQCVRPVYVLATGMVLLAASFANDGNNGPEIQTIEYNPRDRELLTSLGSLVQRSQIVVRGIVGETLRDWNDSDIKKFPWYWYMEGVVVAFQPKQLIIGDQSVALKIAQVVFFEKKGAPRPGEEAIMFLSRKWINPWLIDSSFARIDDIKEYKVLDEWVVIGDRRGTITHADASLEYMASIIRQYDQYLRKPFDLKQYIYFLTSLSESPVRRVHMDAWVYDWYRAIRSQEWRKDRKQILAADDLPMAIVQRMEHSRAHSAASLRTRSREEVEAAFKEHGWWEAMRSDDKDRIRQAFLLLGHYGQHELELYQDLWRADMVKMLTYPDDELPVWAASQLVQIGERKAIPVLIGALRSTIRLNRTASAVRLKEYANSDIPFDLDAPEDERERMVRAWEEWWKRESARSRNQPR